MLLGNRLFQCRDENEKGFVNERVLAPTWSNADGDIVRLYDYF